MTDTLIETMQPIKEVADLARTHRVVECEGGGWKLMESASKSTLLRFYKTSQRKQLDDDLGALEAAKRELRHQMENPRAVAPVAP